MPWKSDKQRRFGYAKAAEGDPYWSGPKGAKHWSKVTKKKHLPEDVDEIPKMEDVFKETLDNEEQDTDAKERE